MITTEPPDRASHEQAEAPVQEGAATSNGGGPSSRDLRKALLQEAHEIEVDCRVSVRCHASAAATWTFLYYVLGLPTAILAALAGISAFNNQTNVAAGFAIAATISAAANTFLNAGQIATEHAKKRSEYEQLKNEVRHFQNITLRLNRPELELVRELGSYSHQRDVLNLESPQVSSRTYRREKKEIRTREASAPDPG